ncbi:MAG TPA: DUF1735 domain-containing protein, partial [Phnomibacter sp.]|nr:DUF1735 domain-containing protein [Phnomibacter sp.]
MKLYSANKLTIGLLTAITLTACEKEPQYLSRTNDRQQSVLYIQQATTFPNTLTTFPFTSSARTFNFNVGLGSLGYLNSSVTVKMQIDMAAFDSINAIRSAAGQPLYEKFPADAYQLSATEATIQAGALKSNTVTLSYISDKFNAAKSYLLPISIKDSDGCKVNKTLQTLFVEVAKLEGRLVPAAT